MQEAPAMTPRPRAKKPRAHLIQIRVNLDEYNLIVQAAEADALPISNWSRVALLAAARRTLKRSRQNE
jgi:uncharacterized protein (DUF1778 family)